jgi:hypothetical protein
MRITREHLRKAANWVWSPIVAPLLILRLDKSGFLEHSGEWGAAMVAWLSAVAASPWFHWIGGGVIGFSIGVWLDAVLTNRSDADEMKAKLRAHEPKARRRMENCARQPGITIGQFLAILRRTRSYREIAPWIDPAIMDLLQDARSHPDRYNQGASHFVRYLITDMDRLKRNAWSPDRFELPSRAPINPPAASPPSPAPPK